MTVSINCVCNFQDDLLWHCQWASIGADRKVDRQVSFSLSPAQFVTIIDYLAGALQQAGKSMPRPNLDQLTLHLRYRRNADAFELRLGVEAASLKAMVDKQQLSRILDYHRNCLQAYAVAIYEGRTPIPAGYPQGYPEPCWRVEG